MKKMKRRQQQITHKHKVQNKQIQVTAENTYLRTIKILIMNKQQRN